MVSPRSLKGPSIAPQDCNLIIYIYIYGIGLRLRLKRISISRRPEGIFCRLWAQPEHGIFADDSSDEDGIFAADFGGVGKVVDL
jgi:hypothetical protein